jgi:hypothetical protein
MRPVWLIEANVDGLPTEPLQAEIRRQGMTARVVKYLPILPVPKEIGGGESLPLDACVIFRGTLPLMRCIQAARRWQPGGWCNFRNLACSTYYAYFGPYLLNREYSLLPCAEALRLTDRLFKRHAIDARVFIRPDSVDKSFTGSLADHGTFTDTIAGMSLDPTTLVLVATPKKISDEWRLVIGNGAVLTGSQYVAGGVLQPTAACPTEVVDFATAMLQQVDWRPDPMFIMDVCASEDGLRLVELNSFSCSGHYLADLSVVVECASRLASCLW